MKNSFAKLFLIITLILTLNACDVLNDPYPSNGGYNSGYGNSYDNDYYRRREAERAREERYRLERERNQYEDERRRLEQERRDNQYRPPAYNPPAQRQPDCPSGFHPGSKCSNNERKNGCRDLRGPNGTSCRSM